MVLVPLELFVKAGTWPKVYVKTPREVPKVPNVAA